MMKKILFNNGVKLKKSIFDTEIINFQIMDLISLEIDVTK